MRHRFQLKAGDALQEPPQARWRILADRQQIQHVEPVYVLDQIEQVLGFGTEASGVTSRARPAVTT